MKAGNSHCVGVDFKTIAEYTACNPDFFQQQKDKWVRDGADKTVLLNEIVPVRDGYYTIEVKEYTGSQHYNYNVADRYKEFVMVTEQDTNESSATIPAEITARYAATGAEETFKFSYQKENAFGDFNRLPVFPDDVWRMVGLDNVTYDPMVGHPNPVAMNESPNQNSRYRYDDFKMLNHPFGQTQQNEFADSIGKPECKDQDFRTLVRWMGCVGSDFDITFENYLKHLPVSDRTQFTSILRAATLGADGVWQIQFKHHVYGFSEYQIIR